MMCSVPPSRPAIVQTSRPLVFAHRGGAGRGPENTLAACEQALKWGADGLECDVHLSRDGVPVVIHDATLERTTDLTGPVAARTAAELARADAAFRFASNQGYPRRGQGIGVPTLEDLLERFADTRVIIEAKHGGLPLARALAAVIERTGATERVCVGSFHRGALDALRAVAPQIPTSASEWEVRWTLYRSWLRWPAISSCPHVAFQVPEHAGSLRVISPAFVRQVHREGRIVQVWVVDDPADVRRLLDWGVDGIISDVPDIAVSTRDEWLARGSGPPKRP
jgi:glycerophosphoryl diester phosphodiesterase